MSDDAIQYANEFTARDYRKRFKNRRLCLVHKDSPDKCILVKEKADALRAKSRHVSLTLESHPGQAIGLHSESIFKATQTGGILFPEAVRADKPHIHATLLEQSNAVGGSICGNLFIDGVGKDAESGLRDIFDTFWFEIKNHNHYHVFRCFVYLKNGEKSSRETSDEQHTCFIINENGSISSEANPDLYFGLPGLEEELDKERKNGAEFEGPKPNLGGEA